MTPDGFPTSLRIGPVVFSVEYSDEALSLAGQGGCMGATKGRDARILIAPSQSRRNMIDTLLHEAVHATIFAYGVPVVGVTDDEQTVRPLASALFEVLNRNAQLLALLGERA